MADKQKIARKPIHQLSVKDGVAAMRGSPLIITISGDDSLALVPIPSSCKTEQELLEYFDAIARMCVKP